MSNKKPWKKKKRATITVPICLDPDGQVDLERAQADLSLAETAIEAAGDDKAAREQARADYREAEKRLADLVEGPESEVVEFVCGAVGRNRFDELVTFHQPTAEQIKREKQQAKAKGQPVQDLGWNPETFPRALVRASLLEPTFDDDDEFDEWWDSDEWSAGEMTAIFQAALNVSMGRRSPSDVGKGSASIGASGGS